MTIPQKGAAAALLSYLWWGSMPLYWKTLLSVSSFEILGHRVVWSAVFTLALIILTGQGGKAVAFAAKNRQKTLWLFLGGYLITLNWGLYIWAVNAGRILETSLGYYINPLVSMLFGMLFFGERLRRAQKLAIAVAAAGVCIQIITIREIPLVSLGLALSFGLYGAMKKAISIEPAVALVIETLSVAPAALAYLCWLQHTGAAHFPYALTTDLLLAGTGVMTSVPLLLFAYAAQRIKLTTIGFIQYVSPTMTFLIGTFIYHEPLSIYRIITFACIWSALTVYSADTLIEAGRERRTQEYI